MHAIVHYNEPCVRRGTRGCGTYIRDETDRQRGAMGAAWGCGVEAENSDRVEKILETSRGQRMGVLRSSKRPTPLDTP